MSAAGTATSPTDAEHCTSATSALARARQSRARAAAGSPNTIAHSEFVQHRFFKEHGFAIVRQMIPPQAIQSTTAAVELPAPLTEWVEASIAPLRQRTAPLDGLHCTALRCISVRQAYIAMRAQCAAMHCGLARVSVRHYKVVHNRWIEVDFAIAGEPRREAMVQVPRESRRPRLGSRPDTRWAGRLSQCRAAAADVGHAVPRSWTHRFRYCCLLTICRQRHRTCPECPRRCSARKPSAGDPTHRN